MVRLRSVDVLSLAKIYGILHMAIGVVVALLLVLVGLIGFAAAPGPAEIRHHLAFGSSRHFHHFLYGLFGFTDGASLQLGRCRCWRNQDGTRDYARAAGHAAVAGSANCRISRSDTGAQC